MARQLSKPERKTMDTCLRRLKQELLSMKESGDGLHDQMNSMMGALQELKLLQLQSTLEQLQISESQGQLPATEEMKTRQEDWRVLRPSSFHTPRPASSSPSEPMSSSKHMLCARDEAGVMPSSEVPSRSSHHGSRVSSAPSENESPSPIGSSAVDLQSILQNLSREASAMDKGALESTDDSNDWTSSLMCQSRNRQPLVLGDNIFADLVGNWLDLPEPEKKALEGERNDHPVSVSKSQEIIKKFSWTATIFKKLLRSVRPDKERLLKEKPGWMSLEEQGAEISKRPKKTVKQKSIFYLPLRGHPQSAQIKSRKVPQPSEEKTPGSYITRGPDAVEKVQPGFDYHTAVWV
ncbi:PAK4-inhibitor INKA2-like [Polyodon spathula]|uniref:PAK4-inhibitor INKA2-like n=1 Tax=Polyodon spathula TaxID=7913 RepID=UPI001B7E245A|nr:PAK4-inhibitor INKA2-like [Polyodon spathula]